MTGGALARASATFYEWGLIPPLGADSEHSVLLAELSQFRGQILHANGRRPGFWRPGLGFADDDPRDVDSFHVTVRNEGELVGCVRIRTLPEHAEASIGRLMTDSQFAAVLKEMRLTRNDCIEVGRWTVASPARGTAIGRTLVLSGWAVGRWLDKRRIIAAAGTRDGQANMLARFGGQILPSFSAKFVAEYDDELAPMYFDLDQPPPRVAEQLPSVERLLKLSEGSLQREINSVETRSY
jgi:predicted GNAT family N-acyltransferase